MDHLSQRTADTTDQADEEIFTYDVSDEALEAASMARQEWTSLANLCTLLNVCC